MAFDASLAEKLEREPLKLLGDPAAAALEKKKMMGDLCVVHRGHMLCGLLGKKLMVRVGMERYAECLALPPSIRRHRG